MNDPQFSPESFHGSGQGGNHGSGQSDGQGSGPSDPSGTEAVLGSTAPGENISAEMTRQALQAYITENPPFRDFIKTSTKLTDLSAAFLTLWDYYKEFYDAEPEQLGRPVISEEEHRLDQLEERLQEYIESTVKTLVPTEKRVSYEWDAPEENQEEWGPNLSTDHENGDSSFSPTVSEWTPEQEKWNAADEEEDDDSDEDEEDAVEYELASQNIMGWLDILGEELDDAFSKLSDIAEENDFSDESIPLLARRFVIEWAGIGKGLNLPALRILVAEGQDSSDNILRQAVKWENFSPGSYTPEWFKEFPDLSDDAKEQAMRYGFGPNQAIDEILVFLEIRERFLHRHNRMIHYLSEYNRAVSLSKSTEILYGAFEIAFTSPSLAWNRFLEKTSELSHEDLWQLLENSPEELGTRAEFDMGLARQEFDNWYHDTYALFNETTQCHMTRDEIKDYLAMHEKTAECYVKEVVMIARGLSEEDYNQFARGMREEMGEETTSFNFAYALYENFISLIAETRSDMWMGAGPLLDRIPYDMKLPPELHGLIAELRDEENQISNWLHQQGEADAEFEKIAPQTPSADNEKPAPENDQDEADPDADHALRDIPDELFEKISPACALRHEIIPMPDPAPIPSLVTNRTLAAQKEKTHPAAAAHISDGISDGAEDTDPQNLAVPLFFLQNLTISITELCQDFLSLQKAYDRLAFYTVLSEDRDLNENENKKFMRWREEFTNLNEKIRENIPLSIRAMIHELPDFSEKGSAEPDDEITEEAEDEFLETTSEAAREIYGEAATTIHMLSQYIEAKLKELAPHLGALAKVESLSLPVRQFIVRWQDIFALVKLDVAPSDLLCGRQNDFYLRAAKTFDPDQPQIDWPNWMRYFPEMSEEEKYKALSLPLGTNLALDAMFAFLGKRASFTNAFNAAMGGLFALRDLPDFAKASDELYALFDEIFLDPDTAWDTLLQQAMLIPDDSLWGDLSNSPSSFGTIKDENITIPEDLFRKWYEYAEIFTDEETGRPYTRAKIAAERQRHEGVIEEKIVTLIRQSAVNDKAALLLAIEEIDDEFGDVCTPFEIAEELYQKYKEEIAGVRETMDKDMDNFLEIIPNHDALPKDLVDLLNDLAVESVDFSERMIQEEAARDLLQEKGSAVNKDEIKTVSPIDAFDFSLDPCDDPEPITLDEPLSAKEEANTAMKALLARLRNLPSDYQKCFCN